MDEGVAPHHHEDGGVGGPATGETAYGRASLALQRAQERAAQAALRMTHQFLAGIEPAEADVAQFRRHSAGLRFAEAVWRVEAENLVAAGMSQLPSALRTSAVGRSPQAEAGDLI
ncbi:hypothetical protein KWG65_01740 [Nocardioides daeguensis]|nr:hypothetical protein [Nocardioides daeguensis]MCR1771491.1 hypothetical protein [Nocardioides daeguensis]